MSDTIRYAVTDGVATITIDREQARNSLDLASLELMIAKLARFEVDDDAQVGIITGSGSVFSAGLDLKSLSSGEIDIATHTARGNPFMAHTKPLIAAVNGPAITGGFEVVLNCDIAIASTAAAFADTHTRVGILPFWGMTVLLPRAIGPSNSAFMSMTGNFIDADQALAWGLVSEVVAPEALLDRARQIASDIVNNDGPGVKAMLAIYRDGAGQTVADASTFEVERALEWQGEGFDGAEISRRFEAIKERGRAQKNQGS